MKQQLLLEWQVCGDGLTQVEKGNCVSCGTDILASTAKRNNGHCEPCAHQTLRTAVGRRELRNAIGSVVVGVLVLPVLLPLALAKDAWRKAQYPKSIEAAFTRMDRWGIAFELQRFESGDDFATSQHFELGLTIRNEFGLWGANKQLIAQFPTTPFPGDDISYEILKRYFDARASSILRDPE